MLKTERETISVRGVALPATLVWRTPDREATVEAELVAAFVVDEEARSYAGEGRDTILATMAAAIESVTEDAERSERANASLRAEINEIRARQTAAVEALSGSCQAAARASTAAGRGMRGGTGGGGREAPRASSREPPTRG